MRKIILLFVLTFIVKTAFSQSLVSIDPDSAFQGTSIKALIVAKSTQFTKATFTVIRLNQGPNQISRDSFSVINDTALYAYFTIAPTRPLGTYNLVVNNSVDGNMNLAGKFWVLLSPNAPALLSIDPDTAVQGSAVKALIIAKNTNFSTANFTVIRLSMGMNQINYDSFSVLNDTALNAWFTIAMTRPVGTYNLTVNNSIDGNMTMNGKFWVIASPFAPKLLSIDPDTIMQGASFKALIVATNTKFSTASFTQIRLSQGFNQINRDSFTVINDTSLYAWFTIAMTRPTGVYNLSVNNSLDGNMALTAVFWVEKSPFTPKLLSIDPDSSEQGTSVKVLITSTQTKFSSASFTVIRLIQGTTQVNNDSFTVINDTTLYAYFTFQMTSPVGLYNLAINNNLDGNLTLNQSFTVILSSKAPKIYSVNPDTAIQGTTVSVTITGINTHFDSGLNLNVSLFRAPNTTINPSTIVRNNDTSLTADFVISPTAAIGLYDLRTSNSIDGQVNLAQSFTVIANPNPPRIVKVDPDTFMQGNKYILKIFATKTNFTKGNKPTVRLNMGPQVFNPDSGQVINDTLLHVYFTVAINQVIGLYNLVVIGGADGTLNLAGAVAIIVSPTAPQISKISPTKAFQGEKVAIYVYGKNVTFTNGTNQMVRLTRGGGQFINPDSTKIVHDSLAIGYFSLSPTAQVGLYTVLLSGTVHGNLTLTQSFEILLPPTAPQIRFITPSRAALGETLNITIHTGNTTLTKATNLGLTIFRQGGTNINATGITVLNDTTVNASITIPTNTVLGMYNARLQNTPEGNLVGNNMFEVIAVPIKPIIKSIDPDSAYYGQKDVVLQLNCSGTKFKSAKILKVEIISPSINLLNYDSVKVVNDTVLLVYLSVPDKAEIGKYDVVVTTDIEGVFMLIQGFTVIHNVSAEELSNLQIKCYPNPVTNLLVIESPETIQSLAIYNLQGELIMKEINLNESSIHLNLADFEKGIYLISVTTNTQVLSKQIIKF